MPVITIAGNERISTDEKRKMVKEVSKIVSEAYGLPEYNHRRREYRL